MALPLSILKTFCCLETTLNILHSLIRQFKLTDQRFELLLSASLSNGPIGQCLWVIGYLIWGYTDLLEYIANIFPYLQAGIQ